MDENQTNIENVAIENDSNKGHHCSAWKCILMGILIFLGAFCAAYVILDWYFKSFLMPNAMLYPDYRMEKFIKHDFDRMEKFARNNNKILQEKTSNIIRLKQDDDEYKIYIDLKAFDNNENNVNIINENNTLTINGKSIKKSKNQEHILRFQQSYMFGNNVDLNNLKKETDGEYLVVTLPINKGNND